MNEIVNKFLLVGDKFMPKIHLRQCKFTYSACGAFTINKEIIQKLKKTGDSQYVYQSKLNKTFFHTLPCQEKDVSRSHHSHTVVLICLVPSR